MKENNSKQIDMLIDAYTHTAKQLMIISRDYEKYTELLYTAEMSDENLYSELVDITKSMKEFLKDLKRRIFKLQQAKCELSRLIHTFSNDDVKSILEIWNTSNLDIPVIADDLGFDRNNLDDDDIIAEAMCRAENFTIMALAKFI